MCIRDRSGGKAGSSIAEINGEEVSIDGFREKVDITSRNSGPNASTMQTVNQVWDQEVRNTIMEQQLAQLGLNIEQDQIMNYIGTIPCLLYTSPSPRDRTRSRMPSSA